MTKDEILNMPAGIELDVLIAKKVIGLEVSKHPPVMIHRDDEYYCLRGNHWCEIKRYSTDIVAAWEVVEFFRNRQDTIKIIGEEWYDGGNWICEIYDSFNQLIGKAEDRQDHSKEKRGWDEPSAPLAICRAVLLAVMAFKDQNE